MHKLFNELNRSDISHFYKNLYFYFPVVISIKPLVTIPWGRISIELDIPLKSDKKDKNLSCLIEKY